MFGKVRAHLEQTGNMLPDADLQIAAAALYHDLELVTGNVGHFECIPDLRITRNLAVSRAIE